MPLANAILFIDARAREGCPKGAPEFIRIGVLPALSNLNLTPREQRGLYLSLTNLYVSCHQPQKAFAAFRKAFLTMPEAQTILMATRVIPLSDLVDFCLEVARKIRGKDPYKAGKLYRAIIDALPEGEEAYGEAFSFIMKNKKASEAFWGG